MYTCVGYLWLGGDREQRIIMYTCGRSLWFGSVRINFRFIGGLDKVAIATSFANPLTSCTRIRRFGSNCHPHILRESKARISPILSQQWLCKQQLRRASACRSSTLKWASRSVVARRTPSTIGRSNQSILQPQFISRWHAHVQVQSKGWSCLMPWIVFFLHFREAKWWKRGLDLYSDSNRTWGLTTTRFLWSTMATARIRCTRWSTWQVEQTAYNYRLPCDPTSLHAT